MFELNKVIRTIDGEILRPFVVQGEVVLCSDRNGNTVRRKLSDFDFSIEEEDEVITVQPVARKHQEVNVQIVEEENNDQLFTSENIEESIFEPEEQKPTPEPPKPTPEPPKPTSIWDTLDGDYL